jgi:hypothetical protein
MQPRLIFRTHYQVDEPAYVEFLIQACTSATSGADAGAVAERLKLEVERRARRRFNVAAAGYAIHLGKALGLLTPYHTWTERGHLVNLTAEVGRGEPERQLSLSPVERVLHCRLFMEADGAALIALARYLKRRSTIVQAQVINSTFIEDTFVEILEEYLALVADPTEARPLQERIDYLRTTGYGGRTGQGRTRQHKLRLHVQTLYRLGIVQRVDKPRGLAFRTPLKGDEAPSSPAALLEQVPDAATLEERLRAGEWATLCANALGMPHERPVDLDQGDRRYLLDLLARFYPEVMASGVTACPLVPVVEAIQIRALAERGWLLAPERVVGVIEAEAARLPGDLRLLTRRGRPRAAIRLSDRWIRAAVGW